MVFIGHFLVETLENVLLIMWNQSNPATTISLTNIKNHVRK